MADIAPEVNPADVAPVTFSLVPGGIDPNAIVDYVNNDSNKKMFVNFTKALKNDYNLSEKDLKHYLGEVDERSDEASWGPIFNIPENIANPDGKTFNLITHYGQITLEQVTDYAKTFVGKEVRLAQIDAQLTMCLLKSFTKDAKCSIELESDKYKINGTKVGIIILKVAQLKARAETLFTNDSYNKKLRLLDKFMKESGNNVEKVNLHVREIISNMAARGLKPESSLYTDLVTGYRACTDKTFVDYISRKQELHDESPSGQNVLAAAEELMEFAVNKYKQQLDQGEWKPTQSESNEEIIALRAEVERLNNSKSKKVWTKAPWKSIAPTNVQPKVKSVAGKTYHWCPNHQEWTIHKPEDCYKTSNGTPAAQTESTHVAPTLRLSEALSAISMQD